ncbi:ADP-sugar diphosphatase [Rhizodiscina lignyota]|uniref:ADP-sugar diphosphatase n=1 Tax=Rhizodiscina lignyota TaxID=1504668 RepID=A0A9P4IK19_9PEZI|nr:ADP-sugar diphosphatase [Rhizodiscina lignyota]
MSNFVLPNSDPKCTVNLTQGLTKDQLLTFRAFKEWINTLQQSLSTQQSESHPFHSSPYKLRKIDIQAVDFFGGSRIGFIKLKAEVSNDNGEKLPGAVFLRGGSVAMLLILQPDDVTSDSEDDKYAILAVQPRIPVGSLAMSELPAGMLDDSGTFAGGAAKEIEEETGMRVAESDLLDMTKLAFPDSKELTGESLQAAMYPSPGGSDEFIPLFLHQRRVPRAQLKEWQGKLTGLREEGEKITLRLVKLRDLWKVTRDGKTLAAIALYEGLRREGKI